jgi:hypothetical protein
MFAAAAIFAQMAYDAAKEAARWLATKTFVIVIIMVVVPSALKGVLLWLFDWLFTYGRDIASYLLSMMQSEIQASGMAESFAFQLTGPGGYLAIQTGLIDYASIIFTGWGVYWVVAVLAKMPTRFGI